jgi:hypothetical protein
LEIMSDYASEPVLNVSIAKSTRLSDAIPYILEPAFLPAQDQ